MQSDGKKPHHSLLFYVDKCIFNFYLTRYSLIKIIFLLYYGTTHNITLEFIMSI